MKKSRLIAMYLPQFHRIPENDKWWGEGFTDWVSVKKALPLFYRHKQPKKPMDNRYYDLSDVDQIRWQVNIANNYGIDGFCIYHYWFSSNQMLLGKPAEIILNNKDINTSFFFGWDNASWIRTWSKFKGDGNVWNPEMNNKIGEDINNDGCLAKLEYGTEEDWKTHFNYLVNYFRDSRYIKVNNKPVFLILNNKVETVASMCSYWNNMAKQIGFAGMYFICRYDIKNSMNAMDAAYLYEPINSGWQSNNMIQKGLKYVKNKLAIVDKYNYDRIWKKIIRNAKRNKVQNIFYGSFVNYDDSPRRGKKGKVVVGGTPEKFCKYLSKLYTISNSQNKEFLFLTAWNEWGEGAYLEPDIDNGYEYLEAVRKAKKLCSE